MQFNQLNLQLGERGPALGIKFLFDLTPTEVAQIKTLNLPPQFGITLLNDSQLSLSVMTGTVGHAIKSITPRINSVFQNDETLREPLNKILSAIGQFESENHLSFGNSGKDTNYASKMNKEIDNFNQKFKVSEQNNTIADAVKLFKEGVNYYKGGTELDKAKTCFEQFQVLVKDLNTSGRKELNSKIKKSNIRLGEDTPAIFTNKLLSNINQVQKLKSDIQIGNTEIYKNEGSALKR